jgi:hypothetical protein
MGKWWCSRKNQGLTRRMGDFLLWNKWWFNPEFYRDSSTQNSIWYGYISTCRGKHPAKKSNVTKNWGYHGSGSPVNSLVVSNAVDVVHPKNGKLIQKHWQRTSIGYSCRHGPWPSKSLDTAIIRPRLSILWDLRTYLGRSVAQYGDQIDTHSWI